MNNVLEIIGLLIGILYLYWEYKADRKLWIASVAMPLVSLFVYWNAGLYADFGIDIYYLLIALYGFFVWTRGENNSSKNQKKELPITQTSRKTWLFLILAFLLIYTAIAYVLLHFTDSTVPYWDALNTALSIVAMWMLARKLLEQWIVWLVVDAISSILYVYKGIYFYAGLYLIYTFVAWAGYKEWKRKSSEQRAP